MNSNIIMLLILAAILILSYFIYNKMRWERIILKKQMALGTVNLEERKSNYFQLGSLTTLALIVLVVLINPNLITRQEQLVDDVVSDKSIDGDDYYGINDYLEVEVPVEVPVLEKDKEYEFDKFQELIFSRKVNDIVYGMVLNKERTLNFTYFYISVIESRNDLSDFKLYQDNNNILLDVGSKYLMFLAYSQNQDYYSLVGGDQGLFKEDDGYFEPVSLQMFPDLPLENLEKEKFLQNTIHLVS